MRLYAFALTIDDHLSKRKVLINVRCLNHGENQSARHLAHVQSPQALTADS